MFYPSARGGWVHDVIGDDGRTHLVVEFGGRRFALYPNGDIQALQVVFQVHEVIPGTGNDVCQSLMAGDDRVIRATRSQQNAW